MSARAVAAGPRGAAAAARPMRLRVATYNIHKGVSRELFGLRRVTRIHELRARLHELDADLVFLQEVQGRHERNAVRFDQWPSESQHVFLAGATTRKHTFEAAYGRNASYLHSPPKKKEPTCLQKNLRNFPTTSPIR